MPPPTADEVRAALARCAKALRFQQGRLERLADDLRRNQPPESRDDEYETPSEEMALLTVMHCAMRDHLIPLIHDLERAARKGRRRGKLSPT